MNTDFSDIGLNPNGSYIVVVHGEDNPDDASNGARVVLPPSYEDFDGGGGGSNSNSSFSHTYNGKTYSMRYVTITKADNDAYGMTSDWVDLRRLCNIGNQLNDLNVIVTILSSFEPLSDLGTIYSLLMAALSLDSSTQTDSLTCKISSNWTVKYIQVFNAAENTWQFRASTEYVSSHYTYHYEYYEPSTNRYESASVEGYYPNILSDHYEHKDYMKDIAAWVHEEDSTLWYDISDVEYTFNGRTAVKHYRGYWELNFDPQ